MKLNNSQKRLLRNLSIGSAIFFAALISDRFIRLSPLTIQTLLSLAYIILGYGVFKEAFKNIKLGKIFDENFLMCIATIGAYILGDFEECVAVMLFYQLGEFFQSYAVAKSRKSIKELMDICPEYANVERNGSLETVFPDELAIGDTIVVKPGEKIPIDSVVIFGSSSIDTASLTGESMPRDVDIGDTVFSGCVNLSSLLKLKTIKTYENSTVSKIMELVENSSFNKAKAEKFISRFARVYTPLVVICALITALIPPLFLGSFALWFERALIFLVISCPCALVISVPMSFFAAIGCASKHGILIKGANYLEALAKLKNMVFDKTGTLTEGRFEVVKISPSECSAEELTELGYAAEFYSNHPIAAAVKKLKNDDLSKEIRDFTNIPGKGVRILYRDSEIYAGNIKLMKELGLDIPTAKAYTTDIYISKDGKYMGYLGVSDLIKDDAFPLIKYLKKNMVKTTVLTGDKKESAEHVTSRLGIDKAYSELLPDEKVDALKDIISKSSKNSKITVYVGDGINDAPVLAMADVGIAMGSLGSDAAIEAADIVITDDKLEKISLAHRISRKTLGIAKQNVVFAIGVKLAIMVLGVLGFAGMWAAVFADVGVAFLAILNSMRAFKIN